jgi:hypothetical protein
MCGTPNRSRTTRTGAERPSTAKVPEKGGDAGWATGCPRRHATKNTEAQSGINHRATAPQRRLDPWLILIFVSVADRLRDMAIEEALPLLW